MRWTIIITSMVINGWAAQMAVIVNPDLPVSRLDADQVKKIYLGKQHFIAGTKLVPINLSPNDVVRLDFEQKVLKMSRYTLEKFWTKQHYLGKRPPLQVKSSRSVIAYVKKVEGAVGYVPLDELEDGVTVVYER